MINRRRLSLSSFEAPNRRFSVYLVTGIYQAGIGLLDKRIILFVMGSFAGRLSRCSQDIGTESCVCNHRALGRLEFVRCDEQVAQFAMRLGCNLRCDSLLPHNHQLSLIWPFIRPAQRLCVLVCSLVRMNVILLLRSSVSFVR